MVTQLGTAKQANQQIAKAIAWMQKCIDSDVARKECQAASKALLVASHELLTWIEEQK